MYPVLHFSTSELIGFYFLFELSWCAINMVYCRFIDLQMTIFIFFNFSIWRQLMYFLRTLPHRKFNILRRFLFIFLFFKLNIWFKNWGQFLCSCSSPMKNSLCGTWLSSFIVKVFIFTHPLVKIFADFCNCEIARKPIDRMCV